MRLHRGICALTILLVSGLAACDLERPPTDKEPLQLGVELGAHPVAVFAEESWQAFDTSLPSSRHPYRNNTFQRWTVSAPDCAQAVRVHLSRIDVERDYDAVILRDGDGNLVQSWTGSLLDVTSEAVPGHTLQIELVTDYSITRWGFEVSGVELVEGQVNCPMYMIPRCPDGSMPVVEPREVCGCQPPPHCQSFEGLVVELTTGGGFSGLSQGYRVDGSGALWSLRSFPGQEPEVTPYGRAHPSVVGDLALAVFGAGLLPHPVARGESANMTRRIRASFEGVTSTMFWPAEVAPPEELLDVLTAFKQLLACDDGSGVSATCADSMSCVDTVCTLSTCANVRCTSGTRCEMQPGDCAQSPCAAQPACVPDDSACVCIEIYAPVCGDNDVTYDNSCFAGCAAAPVRHDGACGVEGDSCGGLRGLGCQDGHHCRYGLGVYEAPYPDAAGSCTPEGFCEDVADCAIYPHVMCVGAWSCVEARCAYQCGPVPTTTWQRDPVDFGTTNPYANNQNLGWRVTGEAGATQVRVSFAAFDLEEGYDTVVLYDASWNEQHRYSGRLGAFFSDPVDGQTLYLVFRSDGSVVRPGFRVDAIESALP
ncbi:MAG: CUB domain-containing protein [Pseudomonadota bacterium]